MTVSNYFKKLRNLLTRRNQIQEQRIYVTPRQAGMVVNPDTALQFAAIYRAVSYISSMIAMMPWRVYMERPDGGKETASGGGIDRLIHRRPNREMSAFSFRETLVSWALTWGNGYAEIERDAANRPTALWPISPDRVEPKRDENTSEIYYEVSNARGGKTAISAVNMFHLHGMGFDGITGYSPIQLGARSIGVGMAAEQLSASFFQNGTVLGLTVEAPEQLSEKARNNITDSINSAYSGATKGFRAIVVEEGVKLGNITIPSKDAELILHRKFSVIDIARWYGLPPHILGELGDATFSNIEHLGIQVVQNALLPWAIRIEQEADYKLFSERSPLYTKINMNALLRGDMAARTAYYRQMFDMGSICPNEIREYEDMNPIGPDGDKYLVQLNLTTLENAGEQPDPAQAPEPAEAENSPPDSEDAGEDAMKQARAYEATLRCLRREFRRASDAAKRYADDRKGFIAWMDAFMGEHKDYLIRNLGEYIETIDSFVVNHIDMTRLAMLDYFDKGEYFDIDESAQIIVRDVMRKAA